MLRSYGLTIVASDNARIVRGVTVRAQSFAGWSPGAVAYHVRQAMPRGVEVSVREWDARERVEVTLHVPRWRVGLRRRRRALMVVAASVCAEVPAGQAVMLRWE